MHSSTGRILAAALLFAPAIVSSMAERCPWLTQGTAAAILGGDVTSLVQGDGETSRSCQFIRKHNAVLYELDIFVAQEGVSVCPPASEKLIGIGTGAVQCSVTHSSTDVMEQIDGKVRDLRFKAILTTKGIKLSASQRESQREALRHAAEQVAGNLF